MPTAARSEASTSPGLSPHVPKPTDGIAAPLCRASSAGLDESDILFMLAKQGSVLGPVGHAFGTTVGVVGRGPDVSLSRRGASATLVYMLDVATLT